MNPWAVVLIILAIGGIIVAAKGKQDNVVAALLGRQWRGSTVR